MGLGDGNGNVRNDAKAKEVLDFCLSAESPELRAKVYEIIGRSGLEPNDPMFLVLALTGQMRVFLEAAPEDLGRLLSEWKSQSASSLSEIAASISLMKQTQQEQAEAIRSNMEAVSLGYVESIKAAGMATTSAIADANSETLSRVRQTKKQIENLYDEIMAMRATIEADRHKNHEVSQGLLHEVEQSTREFSKINARIERSVSAVKLLQKNATWLKLAEVISSFPALIIVGLFNMGLGWWLALYLNR
ncbi:MAG: DUF6753 family protein [Waterburya sp.]